VKPLAGIGDDDPAGNALAVPLPVTAPAHPLPAQRWRREPVVTEALLFRFEIVDQLEHAVGRDLLTGGLEQIEDPFLLRFSQLEGGHRSFCRRIGQRFGQRRSV